jgi:hypothetical protein
LPEVVAAPEEPKDPFFIAIPVDNERPRQIVTFGDIFESLAPLFGLNRIVLVYQSFSPAGDWYVVGCLTPEAVAAPEESKAPFFIAIPVDDERPNFLVFEELVVLGQVKEYDLAGVDDQPGVIRSFKR